MAGTQNAVEGGVNAISHRSEPGDIQGSFILALREYLLADNLAQAKEKKAELNSVVRGIKGLRDFTKMVDGLNRRSAGEWALLLARSSRDDEYLVPYLSRRIDRQEKQAFLGKEAYERLKKVSPFCDLNLVTVRFSRQPSNRDDEREFFKALIKEKLLECDTNKTYVLVFRGFYVESAEIFCFQPAELVLDI